MTSMKTLKAKFKRVTTDSIADGDHVVYENNLWFVGDYTKGPGLPYLPLNLERATMLFGEEELETIVAYNPQNEYEWHPLHKNDWTTVFTTVIDMGLEFEVTITDVIAKLNQFPSNTWMLKSKLEWKTPDEQAYEGGGSNFIKQDEVGLTIIDHMNLLPTPKKIDQLKSCLREAIQWISKQDDWRGPDPDIEKWNEALK